MIKRMKGRLTFANVMSVIAVFLALGGTAYALGRNSVGSKQIKKNAVTSVKIKNGAVTSSKLGAGAVGTGSIATGSVGGSNLGTVDTHVTSTPLPADGSLQRAVATCAAGEKLIGGGASDGITAPQITIQGNRPSHADTSPPNDGEAFDSWEASAINSSGGPSGSTIIAWAVCLK